MLKPKEYFLNALSIGDNQLFDITGNALLGADDGELFLQSTESESLYFKEGKVENTSYNEEEGFGLRRVSGKCQAYTFGSVLDARSLKEAGDNLRRVVQDEGVYETSPAHAKHAYYSPKSPFGIPFQKKVNLCEEINAYVRASDTCVKDVAVSLVGGMERVLIVRADGFIVPDVRPLVHMRITVWLEDGNLVQDATGGFGGREDYTRLFFESEWRPFAIRAVEEARQALYADACPAGEMPVIIGNGYGGVLLHEAIGHGLEGDFIARGTSVFTELMGKAIAHKDVTIVDDGTILNRRGSLTVDDEGTPTERTVLIENGTLVGFMHSRLSARLLHARPTGNGRRESYEHCPLVRMRNTFMEKGSHTREDIIHNTKKGIYFDSFSGGSVDIITGKFVFNSTVAHLIENGEITKPVKGATLIGTGYDVLTHIDMVGDDVLLDPGVGTCGKEGQRVPVGVGEPTLRITGGVVVGGTERA